MAEKKGASEGESGKPGGKKMMMIIGAVTLVLVAGGAVAGYLMGSKSAAKHATKAAAAEKSQGKSEAEGQKPQSLVGPMVNIDPFIVNILDDQGTHYLKAAMTLETGSKATVAEIKVRMPEIKDAILLLIGNKTFKDLSDLQGKLQLRVELMARLNKILKEGKIKNIYFTDFVIQ